MKVRESRNETAKIIVEVKFVQSINQPQVSVAESILPRADFFFAGTRADFSLFFLSKFVEANDEN